MTRKSHSCEFNLDQGRGVAQEGLAHYAQGSTNSIRKTKILLKGDQQYNFNDNMHFIYYQYLRYQHFLLSFSHQLIRRNAFTIKVIYEN